MPYTVQQLASLAGVSARTLRYYDGIGLLCPQRAAANG
ncbi:MAG: MerR family DNA-binding transcriptional regulator, partial [Pygmaiobacter sp.]